MPFYANSQPFAALLYFAEAPHDIKSSATLRKNVRQRSYQIKSVKTLCFNRNHYAVRKQLALKFRRLAAVPYNVCNQLARNKPAGKNVVVAYGVQFQKIGKRSQLGIHIL